MQCFTQDIEFSKAGEQFNFSIYSDMHSGSTHCAQDELKEHMDRRAALPNARFLLLGDNWDFVLPNDLRRYQPTGSRTIGYDAILDKEIEDALQWLKAYPIDIILDGNHEAEVLKRHYTNPTERLSQMLGCKYGGYSCFLRYVWRPEKVKNRPKNKCSLNFLLHHGAWGGRVVKGFAGARDYARAYDGWDIFAYGHNHHINVHPETRVCMTQQGKLRDRDVFFVNTGTWLRTATEGRTGYGERAGYAPVVLGSPLVTVTKHNRSSGSNDLDVAISVGDC